MADTELVEFLKTQGHSDERAEQIAGNHPDAVREMIAAQTTAAAAAPAAPAGKKAK